MVRHGETGYLASTAEQWRDAVGRLASDAALRARMGQAGRWRLETRYAVAVGARAWLEVLQRMGPAQARAG
jgi:glycosyltransferase involved in cell wall biosynthesis